LNDDVSLSQFAELTSNNICRGRLDMNWTIIDRLG